MKKVFLFSFNEILEFTNVEKTKATKIMKKLVSMELLFKLPHYEDKRKFIYYINPNVVFKGVRIEKSKREQFKIKK